MSKDRLRLFLADNLIQMPDGRFVEISDAERKHLIQFAKGKSVQETRKRDRRASNSVAVEMHNLRRKIGAENIKTEPGTSRYYSDLPIHINADLQQVGFKSRPLSLKGRPSSSRNTRR